jgi:site-specific DNA-methyltransferase (adenine-specific)
VLHGDSREVLPTLDAESIDAVATDPPYALGFMGKAWDDGVVAFDPAFWADVLRVLKPGGHVVACGGTRTYHRLVCAIEDAGFEIRDQLAWVYGSGFPKSHDVAKAMDKAAGAEREVIGFDAQKAARQTPNNGLVAFSGAGSPGDITAPATDLARQWQGWGTALKPAFEPICLARKPLVGTVAQNVARYGTGAINVDGCRVAGAAWSHPGSNAVGGVYGDFANDAPRSNDKGRFPANLLHDGSDEVLAAFAAQSDVTVSRGGYRGGNQRADGSFLKNLKADAAKTPVGFGDTGSAARFFYTAKADRDDRAGSKHPTVKPVDLMRWLVRLVTPPGGVVLDPFAGTGTTGEAALLEGFTAVLVEREAAYCEDIARRLELLRAGPVERSEILGKLECEDWTGTLFEGLGL